MMYMKSFAEGWNEEIFPANDMSLLDKYGQLLNLSYRRISLSLKNFEISQLTAAYIKNTS